MDQYIKKISDVPVYTNTQIATKHVTAEHAIQRLTKALKLWKIEKRRSKMRRKNDNKH